MVLETPSVPAPSSENPGRLLSLRQAVSSPTVPQPPDAPSAIPDDIHSSHFLRRGVRSSFSLGDAGLLPKVRSRPDYGGEDEKEGAGCSVEAKVAVEASSLAAEEADVAADEWVYPDGGLRAWLVVFGCFLFAATTMGWGLVWGQWQAQYTTVNFAGEKESVVALIGGLNAFSMTATSFVAGRLGDRYGYRRMLIIGSALTFLSFLIMSFATKLWHVFLTQGFLNGVCLGLTMPLYMALPSQWFLKKRGLATGLAVSGSGIGGAISTVFVQLLLTRLSTHKTLLIYSFIHGFFYIIAFFLVDFRPIDNANKARPWLPQGAMSDPVFWSLTACIGLVSHGFLTPYVFITNFTRSQVGKEGVSTPLVLMNVTGAFGRVLAGLVADRLGPVNIFFSSLFIGGLVQLIVWQFAHTYPTILVFSVLFGFTGPIFLSLLPVVVAQLFGVDGLATVVGFEILCNSPGQFLGGTIASAIKASQGGAWEPLIIYSGTMMMAGSLFLLYARFKREPRIFAVF